MKLPIPIHNSKNFSYRAKSKEFVSEASNLGGRLHRCNLPFMDRIYDDACDAGFLIESALTGAKMLFFLINVHHSHTEWNEITYWEFQSQSGQYKAIIFND